MTMTNEEICREHRTAKAPQKQIGILAELNQVPRKEIVEILKEGGEKLPGNYYNKAPKKPAAPAEKKAPDQNNRAIVLRKMIVTTFGGSDPALLEAALVMYEEALKC